jgi:DNA-binding response OmpR family regulator
MRILVVEDEQPLRHALIRFFESAGFQVESAANGIEALDKLGRRQPDLMILDVRMPEMGGVDLLAAMRRLGMKAAVLMLTANEDIEVAKRCLDLGARDYLTKPVSLATLEKAVQWHLSAALNTPRREPVAWSISKLWA